MDTIAYTYMGDYHCIDCTENQFGKDPFLYAFTLDNEGNLINPVQSIDEWMELDQGHLSENPIQYLACSDCHTIIETYEHQGVTNE